MAASYPSSIVSLSTKNDGDTIFASHVDALQDEVIAVETALLNGFQHDLIPLNDDSKSLGSSAKRWLKVWGQDADFDGMVTINGSAFVYQNAIVNGRLTLTTGTPVSDGSAATTLYFTPYLGKYIALYDGSATWGLVAFSEISIAVPASTSQMYDVFVYNNAGTATLELTAWTNDTIRATALVLQDGVLVKSGATTRRYLGSFRTTAVGGQTEHSVTKRYVWNYYNRCRMSVQKFPSNNSWTYGTPTVRQANADTANQIEVVCGVAEAMLDLELLPPNYTNSGGSVIASIGIGEDSTTTYARGMFAQQSAIVANVRLTKTVAIGRHVYSWNEWVASGTGTFYVNFGSAGSTITAGLDGWWEC